MNLIFCKFNNNININKDKDNRKIYPKIQHSVDSAPILFKYFNIST